MKKLISIAMLALLAPGALQAMDAEGNFAIKGAGITSCAQYTQALEAESRELYLFAGWIDGYLSAVNQFQEETFDVAPWQTTELLARLLGEYCQRNPEAQFMLAVTQMLRSMFPARLQTSSEPVEMKSGDNTTFLYKAVLQRVQEALNERGYEVVADGAFGPQTQQALEAFQRENDVPVSGLPDQQTLMLLLRESSFASPPEPSDAAPPPADQ
jgi:hypothetical protein